MSEESIGQRARLGLVWNFFSTTGVRVLRTLVFVALARVLLPSDFGLIALASFFTSALLLIVDSGFGQLIVQRRETSARLESTAFWFSLAAGATMTLALFGLSWPLASALGQVDMGPVLRGLSPLFLITGFSSVPGALLLRNMRLKAIGLANLFGALGSSVAGLSLALGGAGVWSLVAQTLTEAAITGLFYWLYSPMRVSLIFDFADLRELVSFGSKVLAGNGLNLLSTRLDDLLIGAVLGPTALGYYTVAYKLLLQLQDVLLGVAHSVSFPLFSRLQDRRSELRLSWLRLSRLEMSVVLPVFASAGLLAPALVLILFGPEWRPSIPVMLVLACIGPAMALADLNRNLAVATGNPGKALVYVAVNTAVNVVAFSVSVQFGLIWVAASYVLRAYFLLVPSFWLVRPFITFRWIEVVRAVAPSVACTASAFLVGLSLIAFIPQEVDTIARALVAEVGFAATFVLLLQRLAQDVLAEARQLLPNRSRS